jgi:hypothetical protein
MVDFQQQDSVERPLLYAGKNGVEMIVLCQVSDDLSFPAVWGQRAWRFTCPHIFKSVHKTGHKT